MNWQRPLTLQELEAREAKVLRHALACTLGIDPFHVRIVSGQWKPVSDQRMLSSGASRDCSACAENATTQTPHPGGRENNCSMPWRMAISKQLRR